MVSKFEPRITIFSVTDVRPIFLSIYNECVFGIIGGRP